MRKIIFTLAIIICGVLLLTACSGTDEVVKVKTTEEFIEALESGKNIKLKKDLDFSGMRWRPTLYTGSIDGDGHTIKNITITEHDGKNVGVFSNGVKFIGNVNFENLRVAYYGSEENVGGLLGLNSSGITIKDVKVSGVVDAPNTTYVGGLIGSSNYQCNIENVEVNMTVLGLDGVGGVIGAARYPVLIGSVDVSGEVTALNSAVGGILGVNYENTDVGFRDTVFYNKKFYDHSVFFRCKNKSSVTGMVSVGGVVGTGYLACMVNCTNEGKITGLRSEKQDGYVGGLGGRISVLNEITDCANTGVILTSSDAVGGIVGNVFGEGTVAECLNLGEIQGGERVGGIAGDAGGSVQIIECENKESVVGKDDVGGIIGAGRGSLFVSACQNNEEIKGENCVGGIVGRIALGFSGTVCYNVNNATIVSEDKVGGIIGKMESSVKDFDTNKDNGDALVGSTEDSSD